MFKKLDQEFYLAGTDKGSRDQLIFRFRRMRTVCLILLILIFIILVGLCIGTGIEAVSFFNGLEKHVDADVGWLAKHSRNILVGLTPIGAYSIFGLLLADTRLKMLLLFDNQTSPNKEADPDGSA